MLNNFTGAKTLTNRQLFNHFRSLDIYWATLYVFPFIYLLFSFDACKSYFVACVMNERQVAAARQWTWSPGVINTTPRDRMSSSQVLMTSSRLSMTSADTTTSLRRITAASTR